MNTITSTTDIHIGAPEDVSTLTLSVRDGPEVVVRLLATLTRRHCRLLKVEYAACDDNRGRLVVSYIPPARHGHCVAAWVGNLVDVLSVQTSDA